MYKKLDSCIASHQECLFYTNFDASSMDVFTLDELKREDIEFALTPTPQLESDKKPLLCSPLSFKEYKQKFDTIIEHIKNGNTYLLNLTCKTAIQTDLSLKEIFQTAHAKYKLRIKDKFVCFSPECFINIEGDTISTFPMKGTIDASVTNAKEKILSDEKELAEHTMIVDLLRNDLSMVAKDVRVKKFRYIDTINAGEKKLLQVSSHIEATLPQNWRENFSQILKKLLPAGSITGTPKRKTVEIISEIEGFQRGYFCGVFGYYDGTNIQSAVMIRFIEKCEGKLFYKSGGGITLDSDAQSEYQEMLDKIYIP